MRVICAILLISVFMGLSSPVDFRTALTSKGGKKFIVNIDVCNSGHSALNSGADIPFIHSSGAVAAPLPAVSRLEPINPVMLVSLLVYPMEYPPEA